MQAFTSRQRILAAIRFDDVDQVPVSPGGLGLLEPDSDEARRLIKLTDPFIYAGCGDNTFFGAAVEITRQVQDRTYINIYHTPKGDLIERIHQGAYNLAHIEFPLKTPEDLQRFLSVPYSEPKIDLSDYHRWYNRVGEDAMVMVGIPNAICLPATLLSPEDFCFWWADYPELIIELTKVAAERLNPFVERLCQEGAEAFRIIGGEYATVMLGPSAFDILCGEHDAELVEIIHRYEAIAYYHNHGNVMDYLERFSRIGMDVLDPLEAPPWGDVNLVEARRRLPDDVCFCGNLDDMEILDKLPKEEVQRIARERLEAAGARGFMLGGTASGTFGPRAAENFIAMVEVAEEFGRG